MSEGAFMTNDFQFTLVTQGIYVKENCKKKTKKTHQTLKVTSNTFYEHVEKYLPEIQEHLQPTKRVTFGAMNASSTYESHQS